MLDMFNDERRAFQLRINPLGVQADAMNSENEGVEDWAFDLLWDSAGRIHDEGYAVEIAVPFDQLRFPSGGGEMTWGLSVERSYPRRVRHRITSHPRLRDNVSGPLQSFFEVSFMRNRRSFQGVVHDDLDAIWFNSQIQPSGSGGA